MMKMTPEQKRALELAKKVKAFAKKNNREIYVVTHYCFICKQSEVCLEQKCGFVDLLSAHSSCYGKLSNRARIEYDTRVENLSAKDKKTRQKEKRKLYTKEYNRQWNEINNDYQRQYRADNPKLWNKWQEKYRNSAKGKRTTKNYIETHKDEKAEYMAQYHAERKK